MFSDLLFSLHLSWSPLNVFRYITFRATVGALTAFALCYFLIPPWIRYMQRVHMGQVVRSVGPRSHRKKSGTPTMGGVVAIGVAVACILFWARPTSHLVWLALFSLSWFAAIGAVDDWLKLVHHRSGGLSATSKLLWQFVGSFAVISVYSLMQPYGLEQAGAVSVPLLREPVVWGITVYLFAASIVIVGTTNAVNLTDGLDGLAAGCCALAATGLGVYAYLAGNARFASYLKVIFVPQAGELAVIAAIIVGVCLGLLWFNAYPAEIFMGDVGALGLGGILGAMAVMVKAEVVLFIFGGVFVAEALSVLFQVASWKLLKRRIFSMAPLHHHYELRGVPETKVIVRFWIFSVLLIILMLSTLKLR